MGLFDDVKKEIEKLEGKSVPAPGGQSAIPPASPPAAGPLAASPPETSPAAAPQSVTPAEQGRVLLIHGYSANWLEFKPWRDALAAAGIPATTIEIGNYITLNNEVTIKDLGEAFNRALKKTNFGGTAGDDDWTFDAIVHSTGMLVVRQWLTSDPYPASDSRSRVRRLKHLVGLAPATWGSPQAKKGRSWLGALVKGNKDLGPDFLNAGNMVLDGLELGSRYTWELAHKDLLVPVPFYGKGNATPYVAVFIGNHKYTGIAELASAPGTDGTVRWAGCALDTRKVTLDFRRHPQLDPKDPTKRYLISDWLDDRLAAPIIALDGQNHGTILSQPQDGAVSRVKAFLGISSGDRYDAWETEALKFGAPAQAKMNTSDGVSDGAGWQQLVIHMVDDHGDGVNDYNLQIYYGTGVSQSDDPNFPPVKIIADTYSSDNSYRCFYIHLTKEMLDLQSSGKKMWIELIASSGSSLLEYEAYTGAANDPQRLAVASQDPSKNPPVRMEITDLTSGKGTLFYPYTTTVLEVFVEREPMPLNSVSALFTFPERMPPS